MPPTPDLAREIAARPILYALTVDPGSHPHAAQVRAGDLTGSDGGTRLGVSLLGRTSLKNIAAGSQISLLWPPVTAEGYTLIVNCRPPTDLAPAEQSSEEMTMTVTKAVLHRPGEVEPGTTVCGSDCIPLLG